MQLPLNARALVKHDLKEFKRLFGLYLDIQKQIDIDELDDTEIKGRWKSFLGKWLVLQLLQPTKDTASNG